MATALERQRPRTVPKLVPQPRSRPSWRRALHARARNAVLGGLALFVVWQLGMAGGIELARPELRDPLFEGGYRRITGLMARHPQPPRTVVFLGSSMTALGIKADIVDGIASEAAGEPVIGCNLGANLAGPFTQLVYLQRLLRRGVRPDLVVLEVSPLRYETPGLDDIDRFPADMLEFGDLGTVGSHAERPHLHRDWWESHLVPAHGHRLTILNQSARIFVPSGDRIDSWDDRDDHGWRPRRPLTPKDHQRILTDVANMLKPRLAKFEMDTGSLRVLAEVTELMARERIPCIMVSVPAGPLVRSLYPPRPLAQLLDAFQAQSQQYGFTLVDAREWCTEDEFLDSYHLNDVGAANFTDRLVRQAIAPAMARRHAFITSVAPASLSTSAPRVSAR